MVQAAGGDAVQECRPAAHRDGEYRAVGALGVADPDDEPPSATSTQWAALVL